MALCTRKGSVVSAIAVGSAVRAAAEARVGIRAGGDVAFPGLVGLMKDVPPLAILNSQAFLVRVR